MKCESCNNNYDGELVINDGGLVYHLCHNCAPRLFCLNLSPEQFFNIINSGHHEDEFLLHSDFYDSDTGEALQPR